MMNNMMDGTMTGGWFRGGIGILFVVVVVLTAATLIEDPFFTRRGND